jgi:hypothetical protein
VSTPLLLHRRTCSRIAVRRQTYRLIANATALTPHVGKKLELTGTLEDQPGASATSTAASASGPALRVASGKIVANRRWAGR